MEDKILRMIHMIILNEDMAAKNLYDLALIVNTMTKKIRRTNFMFGAGLATCAYAIYIQKKRIDDLEKKDDPAINISEE